MLIQLVALRPVDDGVRLAEFAQDGGPKMEAVFTVDEHHGIPFANPDPDVFLHSHGSADETRRLVAAVIAFAHASTAKR